MLRIDIGSNSAPSISTSVVLAPHFGLGATHHAAERNGAASIGDHAHSGLQLVGFVIDGDELFACPRIADDDLTAIQLVEVERVQRLAAFHQHVIGGVDHIVDRRNAESRQSTGHPCRAGLDLYAADYSGRIAQTERAIRASRVRTGRLVYCFRRGCRGDLERFFEQHRRLAGDADMSQTVGPVTCNFEIDRQIVADGLGAFMIQARQHQPPFDLCRRDIKIDVFFDQFQETIIAIRANIRRWLKTPIVCKEIVTDQ